MAKSKFALLIVALCLHFACDVYAVAPGTEPSNSDLEKRVELITKELRCLVCQNQTIADSQAELALELKSQVREQLARGASDTDVIDFMVHRYGDFILYRPAFKPITLLLWLGPFLLLACSLFYLYLKLRRPHIERESVPESEIARAAAFLAEPTEPKEMQ